MAPATPPPASLRARTPPTPLHGPLHDSYEPYSPRRSKRTTAQSNPYSSFNSEHKPVERDTTPPPTGKRARFASTQLSSPPSSPASPIRRATLHKTPKKTPARRALNGGLSDSDTAPRSLPTPTDMAAVLPTPSKTPKKRQAISSTARILNFQPYSLNDVMPSPRKMRKMNNGRGQSSRGFELFDGTDESSQDRIEVYTDANARVPTLDGSDDNPFVGPRKASAQRPQRRLSNAKTEEELVMDERAGRDEGIVYTFRGKKVFRPYETDNEEQRETSPAEDLAQRSLKRQAGESAQRPLTRSTMKPRLLWPSEPEVAAPQDDEVDEEAVTDIEMPTPAKHKSKHATPSKPAAAKFSHLATPPSTKRTKRVLDRATPGLDAVTEEPEIPASPAERKASKPKNRSPFDDWPRSKAGSSVGVKKREAPISGDSAVAGTKRTRREALPSPA